MTGELPSRRTTTTHSNEPGGRTATREFMSILEARFERSIDHLERIIDHVMSLRED